MIFRFWVQFIKEFGIAESIAIVIGLKGWLAIGAAYLGYFTPYRGLFIADLLWILSVAVYLLQKNLKRTIK